MTTLPSSHFPTSQCAIDLPCLLHTGNVWEANTLRMRIPIIKNIGRTDYVGTEFIACTWWSFGDHMSGSGFILSDVI